MAPKHFYVATGCILFGGTMFSLPGLLRFVIPHQVQRDKLTGSQRQRGMYMNAGKTLNFVLLQLLAPTPVSG